MIVNPTMLSATTAQTIEVKSENAKLIDTNPDILLDSIYNRLLRPTIPNCLALNIHHELQRLLGKTIAFDFVSERLFKLLKYKQQLLHLRQLPVIEQRTKIWYDMRDTLITASDLAQSLNKSKFGNQKQFVVKKSGYEVVPFNASVPPLKWGTMYEQVGINLYEWLNNTHVHEFGLIRHPHILWFGCSPDGITENGIMLELKCPFKRKINGEIIEQYYYQIQGQLEVCDLEECDFLECEIVEYENESAYADDKDLETLKGLVLEKQDKATNTYQYRYSPWLASAEDSFEWVDVQTDFDYTNIHYWKMHKFNIMRVYKDKDFIQNALSEARKTWEQVLMFRQNKEAYDEYMGPPKTKTSPSSSRSSSFKKEFTSDYAFLDE
jgi:putative phage-type endonuclease